MRIKLNRSAATEIARERAISALREMYGPSAEDVYDAIETAILWTMRDFLEQKITIEEVPASD